MRLRRTAPGLGAAIVAVAGCGAQGDYANNPRPPLPINVSAAVTKDRVTVSPAHFGAGPVVILIANETRRAHTVTIETDELGADSPGIKQRSAPINPAGTAQLKLDLARGRYTVSVDGKGIAGQAVRVGRRRASSSNELLTP